MAKNESGIEPALTPKQEAFCHAYIECLNGTKAAKDAGYAPDSAHVEAHRMLRNPKIQARLAVLRKERAEAEGLTQEDILGFYKAVLISDVADLVGEDGKIRNVRDLPHSLRRSISTVKVNKHGMEIALVDKKWAADKYAAHLGMNAPMKIEHTGLSADPDAIAKAIAEAMLNDDKGDA